MKVFLLVAFLICVFISAAKGQGSRTVCEHQTAALTCPQGMVIKITKNFYGRYSGDICNNVDKKYLNIPRGGCRASSSLSKAQDVCNGRQTCNLRASNSVFGDPCVGTYKYMQVEWQCVKMKTSQVCEHSWAYLRCDAGQTLRIVSNLYGRERGDICNNVNPKWLNIPSGGCRASSSLPKARSVCDGRQYCYLKASNSIFGDPCKGTYKYMQTAYECQ